MTVGTRFSFLNNLASHSGDSPRGDICVSACPAPTLLHLVTSCGFSFCQIFSPPSQKVFQAAFTSMAKKWTCDPICPIRCPSFGIWIDCWSDSRKMPVICPTEMPWGTIPCSCSLESGGLLWSCFFLQMFLALKNPNLIFCTRTDKFPITVLVLPWQGQGSSGLCQQRRRKTPKLWGVVI